MRNFFATHQWLRELKRRGCRMIVGVYFKIPDDEALLGRPLRHDAHLDDRCRRRRPDRHGRRPQGYKLIVPRRIRSDEIRKIRALPQDVGWHPAAIKEGWHSNPFAPSQS